MRTGIHVKNPSHVLGKLVDVALGKLPAFEITGVDWATRDGTGIRDYIHVWDLAQAHVQAVAQFPQIFERSGSPESRFVVINLGTGRGVTVRELVTAFKKVYGQTINKLEKPPRPGDVAGAYANADTARNLIGWEARQPIENGIADALRWGKVRDQIIHD
jgi:UDP-glucose 4-epimerase